MLTNKVAIITGGTRGIGYAIAKKFLDNNAKVVILGSKEETVTKALTNLKAENELYDGEIHAYRWDLDEVLRSKEWECLKLDSNEIQECPNYEKLNSLTQGTMVVWQNFDIAEQKSNGHAYEYLSEKIDEINGEAI